MKRADIQSRPIGMVAIALALALQIHPLPEKAKVQFSGIPAITGGNVQIQFHNVKLEIGKAYVDVTSTTLVKNDGPAGAASIKIPWVRVETPDIAIPLTATWANSPLSLSAAAPGGWAATGQMQAGGSYALRIAYRVPVGTCGFDGKQRLVAYDLASAVPVGTLMVSYSYASGVVFHLPQLSPDLGWQIGPKGAFIKKLGYAGDAGYSSCAFYPAGFKGR